MTVRLWAPKVVLVGALLMTLAVDASAQKKTETDEQKIARLSREIAQGQRWNFPQTTIGMAKAIEFRLAIVLRGYAYDLSGQCDKALADIDLHDSILPRYAALSQAVFKKRQDTGSLLAWGVGRRATIWQTCKKDSAQAIAIYDDAIRKFPANDILFNDRGWAKHLQGDQSGALADLNESIRLDPKSAQSISNRGVVFRALGDYDRAIADLDTAIRLNPQKAEWLVVRGETWRMKGDLDRALTDITAAIAAKSTSVYALIHRARLYRYRGENDKAIADLDIVLKQTGGWEIAAFAERGLTYERIGNVARARADFDSASKLPLYDGYELNKPAQDTARSRLIALDSGIPSPNIPAAPKIMTNATAIPTPAVAPASVKPSGQQPASLPDATKSRRVALVIGNSTYKNVPVLNNPQKDAEIIGASLRNIGFDQVTVIADASREKLADALRSFAEEADQADWAMVYYAGHGIEIGGQNFLIPIEARLAADRDVAFETIGLDQIKLALGGAKKIRLIVWDACRVNPFAPRMRQTEMAATVASESVVTGAASTRAIGRGLTRADAGISGPQLIVYAAKDGQVALDGDGANSPFAVAMVQRLATPGVEINKMFRLVRDDVMEATAGRQEPFTYGSLPGREDFFFVAGN